MENVSNEGPSIREVVDFFKDSRVDNQDAYEYLIDKLDPYHGSLQDQIISELKEE